MSIKYKHYSGLITVDATVAVAFEAPEDMSLEELKEMAMALAETPSVCHQCGKAIDVAELQECIEIIDADTGLVVK